MSFFKMNLVQHTESLPLLKFTSERVCCPVDTSQREYTGPGAQVILQDLHGDKAHLVHLSFHLRKTKSI